MLGAVEIPFGRGALGVKLVEQRLILQGKRGELLQGEGGRSWLLGLVGLLAGVGLLGAVYLVCLWRVDLLWRVFAGAVLGVLLGLRLERGVHRIQVVGVGRLLSHAAARRPGHQENKKECRSKRRF